MYEVLRIPLDEAQDRAEWPVPDGTALVVLDAPANSGARLSIGRGNNDLVPIRPGRRFTDCDPFDRVYVTAAAVAGGELVLWIGNRADLSDAGGDAQGPADHDAEAAGRPVRIAGVHRVDAPTVDDGDVVDLLADDAGRVFVRLADALSATADSVQAHGGQAHDAAIASDPVLVGLAALAFGTPPVDVDADADAVRALADRGGRLRVRVDRGGDPLSAADSLASGANVAGLTVALDSEGNAHVSAAATIGGAGGDVVVEGSVDNGEWFELAREEATAAAAFSGAWGFRYLRIRCLTDGVDVSLAISAKP